MSSTESFRKWAGRNLSLLIFLCAYFFTVVFANLLYPFFGSKWAPGAIGQFTLLDFPTAFTLGYWFLLFIPFIVTPILVIMTRATLAQVVGQVARVLPEFSRRDYVIILIACYLYVVFSYWQADVHSLVWRAQDATQSVQARFKLLSGLGYWPQMVLKSLLMFLSVYSFTNAFRTREPFWICLSMLNFLLMSALLLLLNMKWPALLLYVAFALCIFLFSTVRIYFQVVLAFFLLITAYLSTAAFVERGSGGSENMAGLSRYYIVQAFDRMAVGYPYYYEIFTEKGQICGTLVDRVRRIPSPCQPTTVVYHTIFGTNDPGGTPTQPAPVHIYGYALGGWSIAILELGIASVIMGAFMCLPFGSNSNATVLAMIVMSGLVGYFLTQLPIEGAILYDHGIVWWLALVVGYAGLRHAVGGAKTLAGARTLAK